MNSEAMIGRLVVPWIGNNEIFNASSVKNRDNTFGPYIALRNAFMKKGIILNTADLNNSLSAKFDLHQDFQATVGGSLSYLLMFESPMIKSENGHPKLLRKYRKIFTWNDNLVDGDRYIKINFPNMITIPSVKGFQGRDRFCCLIAGNKDMKKPDPRNLYPQRVNTIRWYEKNALDEFDLYGTGWDLPTKRSGIIGKSINLLYRIPSLFLEVKYFPSYRGLLQNKKDALCRTKYAICYENVRDLPGYITEKIFDCFTSGCIPIYWGANNIDDYIPSNCFIDRRRFETDEMVYQFLKSITEDEFRGYQERIVQFLSSQAAYPFSSEFFAKTVVDTVTQDLGL